MKLQETVRMVAEAVILASDLRENSYRKEEAKKIADKALTKSNERYRAWLESGLQGIYDDTDSVGYIDFSQFYSLSIEEASNKVAEQMGDINLGEPIRLMLTHSWNESIGWAHGVLRGGW